MSSSTPSSSQNEKPIIKKQRLSSPQPTQSSTKRRTFEKIPIFIVDYHNDVLDFMYRCIATRHLPLSGNTLIHFDSHPDMVISHRIKPATVFDKDQLLDELSIENWIMPACYAGHFNKIVWVKNSWCTQIPEGKHDFNIGAYDNEIRVDLPVDYFISEGNFCDTSLLENSKPISLTVTNSDELKDDIKIPNETGAVILDIDLDFFSVTNPFLELYKKANLYAKLQKIFAYTESGDPGDDADRRRKQLKDLENVFFYLDINRSLDGFENTSIPPDRFDMIQELVYSIIDNYPDDEIDWILINDAGNTSDHNGLPHHRSTDEELEKYYLDFENFLKQTKIVPNIVTVARSSSDDYCPKDQVDGIQERVVKVLQDVYKDLIMMKPILSYDEEVWDVMKL